jgi:hypothetical protein
MHDAGEMDVRGCYTAIAVSNFILICILCRLYIVPLHLRAFCSSPFSKKFIKFILFEQLGAEFVNDIKCFLYHPSTFS